MIKTLKSEKIKALKIADNYKDVISKIRLYRLLYNMELDKLNQYVIYLLKTYKKENE